MYIDLSQLSEQLLVGLFAMIAARACTFASHTLMNRSNTQFNYVNISL